MSGSPPSTPATPSTSSSTPGTTTSGPPPVFGAKDFTGAEKEKICDLLQKRLGKEHLATRAGAGGAQLTYIEGWQTIQIANSIFGFNGWSSSVVELSPDFIEEGQGKFKVGVTAVVKVTLKDGTSHEDVGYGLAENPRKGIAIENAKKEAVTDARKRALRLFGNALGNCIYDKGHLKRLKTAPPDSQGYLPSDTTMELMNRANPDHDGTKQSNGNSSAPSKAPSASTITKPPMKPPTSYVPVKSAIRTTALPPPPSLPVASSVVQIQSYHAPQQQQQPQQSSGFQPQAGGGGGGGGGEDLWTPDEAEDMAALMAAADNPYDIPPQYQGQGVLVGNGYGMKRSSPS